MDELKFKFKYITPTELHIGTEIATSCFYASSAENFDARIGSLIEVFLLEIYRCKLCQFTSSLKNKVCHHVLEVHQLHQATMVPENADQEEHDSFGTGEDLAQGNKESEENLEKMPFLYRMLNTMSPESCDISLGDQSANTNLVSTSEVNSLFEGEQSDFQLDESVPSDSVPPSSTANSPKSKHEDDAQCEHLLSLGLYRISNIRPASSSTESKLSKTTVVEEPAKDDSRISKESGVPGQNNEECINKPNYVCSSCQLELETKDTYKIHMQCHKPSGGFKCVYCGCLMTEWSQMDKHLKGHCLVRMSYQCQVCEKRFMTQSAWKSHMRGHDKKSQVFLCTKCPLSFESEGVRDLHVTCHHEEVFKCCQCGFVEPEWNKVYEHLCTHDDSLKPFVCNTCNQRFFKEVQLKSHSSKHKKIKNILCRLCDQKFRSTRQMNRHQKRFHNKHSNGESNNRKLKAGNHTSTFIQENSPPHIPRRDFTCDICKRKCSSKLALQRHMGVHAGEKPFHCQHCEYKTRLKASLTQHMRVHTVFRRKVLTYTYAATTPGRCSNAAFASIHLLTSNYFISTQRNITSMRSPSFPALRLLAADIRPLNYYYMNLFELHVIFTWVRNLSSGLSITFL
ncbi:transcriptional repressor CTCFL-like isoform X2 [Hyperolius riggenbachi]|uniref:transcriptional repressor CTCFL-like isoform X2 n=1 Tax=Hyperolius riggenbachi TaxID=752182 RepID=UPI0035A34737